MIQLPSHLSPFKEDAEKSIAKKLVKDVEFSGGTYQVLVADLHTHQEYWVFLQLGGKGQIKDAFCSCEEGNSASGCLHLATAYLCLYGSHDLPLHQRFAHSLWNQLCRLFEERLGGDPSRLLKLQKGHYVFKSGMDRIIFSVKGLTNPSKEQLEWIIHKQNHETEETSLKFSDLSSEDINQWREGRPNSQLRYDLSYWSDLAKWLMKLQEQNQKYTINFRTSPKNLPNFMEVNFKEIEIGFSLSESHLATIIPALRTVNSPLIVKNVDNQGISQIIYDKQSGILHIKAAKGEPQQMKNTSSATSGAVKCGNWLYIPGEGFYTDEPHQLLETPDLEGDDLSHALTEHSDLISLLLKDTHLHQDPITLSFQLSFDAQWNLHIQSFVFDKDDLIKGNSRLIGDWVYLSEEGFYPLEGKRFDSAELVIPIQQVADFVTQNRAWFNSLEGFQTHLKGIEYQLNYEINDNNRLTFQRAIAKKKGSPLLQDFGAWIYMEGLGFYPKTSGPFNHLLQKGVSLSAEQIPLFLSMNRDELALIPQFFMETCPISKASLKVELIEKNKVQIFPEYELLPDYQGHKIRLFDQFIYIDEEGFCELPAHLRLPDRFRSTVILEGDERDQFVTYEIENIRKFTSYIDPKLIKPTQKNLVTESLAKATEKGRGWYRFNFFYRTEKGMIPLPFLRTAIKKKQSFAFHKAGLIDLRESRYDWIRRLDKDRFSPESDDLFLTTLEFIRLNAFDPIEIVNGNEESQKIFDELTHLETPEEPDMGGLTSHLRPYQDLGVRWLWFLYRHQLSGLLCDDMGLGKTHQAMALLACVSNLFKTFSEGTPFHFLIVCPTSVIYHWQEKLQQFLPGLRVCTFYGTKRSLEAFHNQYDILLTSYGVLRNEKELLSQVPFEVAIFDEIQIAKNQFSQVYGALVKIKSQMKLGMTGTPIENRLRELKSLFDIVLPTYMPADADYKEYFIKPIEKGQEPKRKALLNRLIHPFTLRRKKEDVLKDLPEKIEEVSYCDLSPQQHMLYSEVLEQRRRHLLEELKDEHNPVPYLHIFALLSSLKQICDHPAVYLKTPSDYSIYQSGKWELFVELLREARESQQKVVVFSQYLHMLDIIQNYLTEQNIGFASLRGATQNRKEQVHSFNKDPQCEVFVGSLQAAGLGIDLTAGSVVIHYDRWWNAARENQATDRVHRIGQVRGVQVFKLVTKGTFEEKIDAMIFRKGQLMEEVVQVDDQSLLKTFSREDLIDLLQLADLAQEEEHPTLSDID